MYRFLVTRDFVKPINGVPKKVVRGTSLYVHPEDHSKAFYYVDADEIEEINLWSSDHAALIPFSAAGQDLLISSGIGLPMHGISFPEPWRLPEVIDLAQYSDYAVVPAPEAIVVQHLPACLLVRIDAPSLSAQLQDTARYDIRIKINDRLYVIEQQPLTVLAGKA